MLTTAMLALALTGDTSVTIHGLGVTNHGVNQSPLAADRMPRKLTDDGSFVWHPEFGITVKTDNWQYGAVYLKDCFNNPTGTAYIGPKYDFLRYFSIGAIAGVYVRKQPGDTIVYIPNQKPINYGRINSLPLSKKVGPAEISPLAAVTASITIPITQKVGIEFNALTNVYISHANVGLKFTFK